MKFNFILSIFLHYLDDASEVVEMEREEASRLSTPSSSPPSSSRGVGTLATPTPDLETSQMGMDYSPIGLDDFGNESADDETLRQKIHHLVRDLPSPPLS